MGMCGEEGYPGYSERLRDKVLSSQTKQIHTGTLTFKMKTLNHLHA